MPYEFTPSSDLCESRPDSQRERSFLLSRSQPKPRRNLRSRYANMMESIRSGSGHTGSSISGSFTTRRARPPSITSPSSQTSPTALYQGSDHERPGTGSSVRKLRVLGNQTPQASLSRILALPPWLQDAITELDASHPLRAVFPTLHDTSHPDAVKNSLEKTSDYQMPRRAHFDDANGPPRFPSTSRIQSRACQPGSDTSDELQSIFSNHPSDHNNSLLHLQSGSPTPFASALSQPEGAFSAATDSYPSSSARIDAENTVHISDFETTLLPASSLNYNSLAQIFPPPRRDVECDGIFRYNPSQADSTTVLPPSKPFVFERSTRVYFDSPVEDPIGSDPLEPSDYDPFKLDADECKNLSFKWAPFDTQTGTRGEPTVDEPETNPRSPDFDEVNPYCD